MRKYLIVTILLLGLLSYITFSSKRVKPQASQGGTPVKKEVTPRKLSITAKASSEKLHQRQIRRDVARLKKTLKPGSVTQSKLVYNEDGVIQPENSPGLAVSTTFLVGQGKGALRSKIRRLSLTRRWQRMVAVMELRHQYLMQQKGFSCQYNQSLVHCYNTVNKLMRLRRNYSLQVRTVIGSEATSCPHSSVYDDVVRTSMKAHVNWLKVGQVPLRLRSCRTEKVLKRGRVHLELVIWPTFKQVRVSQ